jgi:Predicted membrane protein
MPEIPVYLFTGFLEAGKTRFIQETLGDERFNTGERTLLLLCEEGIEEYDPDHFAGKNIFQETCGRQEDLTPAFWDALMKKYRFERAVVEYNGMWMLDDFYRSLPEGFSVYQEICFADASTFISYNQNMRQLVADKLKSCEMVVFNRTSPTVERIALHKIVRGLSRRCDIAYETSDGQVEYDDIEDPLPFDISAPIIEIADQDYAIWYRDMTEEPEKYDGKTVRFLGIVALGVGVPRGTFLVGRHVMTCCAADISYAGLVCLWDGGSKPKNRDWVRLTAKLKLEHHEVYAQRGPVLYAVSVEKAKKPAEEVATFY